MIISCTMSSYSVTCPWIQNITQISCIRVAGIWETSVNSKHYTDFVYSCHWNLGNVREFKTLYRFRVFLSLESGKRPWIQNIIPISCILVTGIWETSVNSKHYTNFVYSCHWIMGDVREFKTLYQFRVFLSLESGRRPWIQNIIPISCILVIGLWKTSVNSKYYTNFVYSCHWDLGDVREFKTLYEFRVFLSLDYGRPPWIQNITPISCILVTGILETSANSKHYTNFVYPCQWNLGDVREFKTLHQFRVFLSVEPGRRPWIQNIVPISCIVTGIWETSVNSKHYTNFVYSCQWIMGDLREFKTLHQFRVFLSLGSWGRPWIQNIIPISCTLASGIWETSVNSKHYTNFVYSCHWIMGDLREFKTLHKFRVFLSVEPGRRPWIQNIIPISCTLVTGICETSVNSKHYTNFVYCCQWNLGDVREFQTLHQFVYSCQWNLGDVREFKILSEFRAQWSQNVTISSTVLSESYLHASKTLDWHNEQSAHIA